MNMIRKENGSLLPHGAAHGVGHSQELPHGAVHGVGHGQELPHGADHNHGHEHSHEHAPAEHRGPLNDRDRGKETVALLTYMLHHNEDHAAELDQMADNLERMGMRAAAKKIRDSVSDYQKGNRSLEHALSLVKRELGVR